MRRRASGAFAASASPTAAPTACTPPSTCRISPLMPRARSDSRNSAASATGLASAGPSRGVRGRPTRRPDRRIRGCPRPPASRSDRPRSGSPGCRAAPRSRARYREHGLERGLRDAHPVVGRPGDRCVEVQADDGRGPGPSPFRRCASGARVPRRAPSASTRSSRTRRSRSARGAPRSHLRGHRRARRRSRGSPRPRCGQRPASSSRERRQVLVVVHVQLQDVGRIRAGAWRRARSYGGRARSWSARSRRPPPGPAPRSSRRSSGG